MIVFENPFAFLFFLFLPFVYVCRKMKIFTKIAFPLTISDWNGRTFVWKGSFFKVFSIFCSFIFVLGFSALVFALADPVLNQQEKIYTSKGTDILFVLDNSPSMAARDISVTNTTVKRIDAAKVAIKTLVNEEKGASFGLVAMANQAVALVPPTNDRNFFLKQLESVEVGSLGDGTALGIGLSSAVYHLAESSAPRKCIILITDGENNAGSIHPETAALLAKENDITLYTFGIGTIGTVTIDYIDPNTGKIHSGFYESKFNPEVLELLAGISNGRYFGVDSFPVLCEALAEINRKESTIQSFYLRTIETHCCDYFLMLAGALFVLVWIFKRIFLKEIL